MLHRVKDLSPEQRATIEALLGHRVSEDEAVSVSSLRPSNIIPSKLTPAARLRAFEELNAFFAEGDEAVAVDPEDEEALVNEAIRTSRPHFRPLG